MKQAVRLGTVQETLLVPLYARALESRRARPILSDPKAVEVVDAIEWDFQKFAQRTRVIACVLRTAMFDEWIAEFLRRHPGGTVVEIGAGLNTRFERLDNGRLHWFDLDLPDTVELRRRFFQDSERRTTLAGSFLDPAWMAPVLRSPGPYFFVAEAVFVYLKESEVKAALARIGENFPGAAIAFDTTTSTAVRNGNKDFARRKVAARFEWACGDPREIERWNVGLHLRESRTLLDASPALQARLSRTVRSVFGMVRTLCPKMARAYLLNLFESR